MTLRDAYRDVAPLTAALFIPFYLIASLFTGNWAYVWMGIPAVILLLPFQLWLLNKWLPR